MAEREGFEPSIRDKPDTPLAGERLRPLGHLSNMANLPLQANIKAKKNQPLDWFSQCGGRGRSRTCDRLVRSQVLYPAELRVRNKLFFNISCLGDSEHGS